MLATENAKLVMIPIGDLYVDRHVNICRPVEEEPADNYPWNIENSYLFKSWKDISGLAKSLADRYLTQHGIIIVDKIPENILPRIKAELEAAWESVKANTTEHEVMLGSAKLTLSPADFQIQFEKHYTQSGKIRMPKYRHVNANRRGVAFLLAEVIAMKGKAKGVELSLEGCAKVPCEIREYATAKERMEDNVVENTLKNTGTRPMSAQGLIESAFKLYREPDCKQSQFRHIYKDGVGQKLWWLCELNAKHKQLSLFEDMHKAAKLFIEVGGSYKPFKVAHDGTVKEAEAFIKNPTKGKVNSKKVASGKDIDAVIKQCNCTTVAFILKCARDNDLGALGWVVAEETQKPLDEVFIKLGKAQNVDPVAVIS